jgi:hypothetical protein
MAKQKHQLPKDAINPRNDLETNALYAELGPVAYELPAWFFYLALTEEGEMEILAEIFKDVIEDRNVGRFEEMLDGFKLAVNWLNQKRPKPHKRTLYLATRYELGPSKHKTAAGLLRFLKGKGVKLGPDPANNLSYARFIRRRLDAAREPGRPRKSKSR